ncbi:hypothetical protein GOP47_0026502 [Adiantum capillus-veneris]|nr:hypothetical protein GOP47_0026502 [Adiantum capillus-veneris]
MSIIVSDIKLTNGSTSATLLSRFYDLEAVVSPQSTKTECWLHLAVMYILMLRGLIILPCKHLACWPLFCSKVHIDVEGIDPIAL